MTIRIISLAVVSMCLAGCAGEASYRKGRELISAGQVGEGLESLQRATQEAPENHEFRNTYFRQREVLVAQLLAAADVARQGGREDEAEAGYRRVMEIEPNNDRARSGLAALDVNQRHKERLKEAEALLRSNKVDAADTIVRRVLAENPGKKEAQQLKRLILERSTAADEIPMALQAGLVRPVNIDLRDAPLKSVFDLLTRASGVNFVLDKEIRADAKATLNVKGSPVEDVIRLVITMNQLDYKILNDNTMLIFPNSQTKAKDYKELMVKGFYLANADAKQIANTIKTLVKTKDIVVDEKLNYIAMRDTPEAIRMAERLIAAQDLPDPEVLLDLEVLEVSVSRLMDLGIRYPEQVSYSLVGADNVAGTLRLSEWQNRNSGLVRMSITNPTLILNLKKTDSDTNLLANPRIRVKNKDKAKIHIGERVPVITTTSTANVGVSEAVNYLDVGLKLEIEPVISLSDEVSIKVGLEVSNILETITRASGLQTYRLGTRNAATSLRLRDSETQVLAGLIQDDDRRTANKVPGFGDIPILGRLFSSNNNSHLKTEIILLITPRIIRNLNIAEMGSTGFFSGTEAVVGSPPVRLKSGDPAKAKAVEKSSDEKPAGVSTPAVDSTLIVPVESPDKPADQSKGALLPLPSAFSSPATKK